MAASIPILRALLQHMRRRNVIQDDDQWTIALEETEQPQSRDEDLKSGALSEERTRGGT